jgi:predicted Ser/Thr protein kinase
MPTQVSSPRSSSSPSSDSSEDGRFLPGTLLGDRYRIISLLGAGGMGEVYRATDLRLGQAVALKFLPEEASRDPKTLARFNNEVKIARQVAHPNVCRVYDIGEVEGLAYLSMEYVDGEDLNSLLRRIGRLPSDKAIEISRKLCAGLAAAHDKGVLHRDLKPANIMIDGRGHVLITDFGLAGVMGQIEGLEARNGTPGYMSPEQLAGTEVSAQSDVFALGVVLYEMFTGKRPYTAKTRAELMRLTGEGKPASPRSIVKDIDPAVETVILRCLDPDPRRRPSSALAVSAALPGGDPLAAALAAGETPSPQMVAESGEKCGMGSKAAFGWMAAVILGLAAVTFVRERVNVLAKIPFDQPPEVLAQKSREILTQLGYGDGGKYSASGFAYRVPVLRYMLRQMPGDPWPRLAKGRPAGMRFWYRSSSFPLAPQQTGPLMHVTISDPPPDVAGMTDVMVDPQGRLLAFTAVPPDYTATTNQPHAPPWNTLFQAAGLDIARFRPVDSRWTPPAMADARAAWDGSYSENPDIPIHIEAAAFQGKPVFFVQYGPWMQPPRPGAPPEGRSPGDLVYLILQLVVVLGSIPFARYNLQMGRGDTHGAFRLGLFATALNLAAWIIGGTHVGNASEGDLFFMACMHAVFGGVTLALTYISFEPFVRRKWPQTIISWSRIMAGKFRDPVVGKETLIGTAIGLVLELIGLCGMLVHGAVGTPSLDISTSELALMGARQMTGLYLWLGSDTLFKSLGILFLLFLARTLLRKQWLAAGLLIIVLAGVSAPNLPNPLVAWPTYIVMFSVMVLTLMYFGLWALVRAIFTTSLLGAFPLTTSLSAWYGWAAVVTMIAVLGPAVVGFRTSLAGQRLFRVMDE